MKKSLLAVATVGLTVAAFGQGAVILDNSSANGWLDIYSLGNHYYGPFGLELWYRNGTTADNAINLLNGVNPSEAYSLLTADGFTLATHMTSKTTPWAGWAAFIGEADMPGIDRTIANGTAVLGLAIWAGNGNSFLSSYAGGVVTFVNPTSDYTIPPPNTPVPPALDNWDDSLIMGVPEPGTFALAGLGAALLSILRRRR
jgi:hypothetical protein